AAYGLVDIGGPPTYTIVHGWGPGLLRGDWHDVRGWRGLIDFPRAARWQAAVWLRGRPLLQGSERILAVSHAVARQLRRYRRASPRRPAARLRRSRRVPAAEPPGRGPPHERAGSDVERPPDRRDARGRDAHRGRRRRDRAPGAPGRPRGLHRGGARPRGRPGP